MSAGRSLRRQLLRMGWASARRAGGGRVRAAALLLATLAVAVGLTAEVAVDAAYSGMYHRSAQRSLVYQAAHPDRPAVAEAVDGFDDLDGLQYSVVWIRPLTANAPLPPGLDRWPDPGQAVLSPALRTALRTAGDPDRYGDAVGTIGDEGLASPGERYAYVNPKGDRLTASSQARKAVGFGTSAPGASGDWIFVAPRERLRTGLYLVLVPALVLAFVAARMGSQGRDRRTALVSALGGGLRTRVWLNLGESALPVLTGAVLGVLPAFAVATGGDIRLPWIGYELSAADLRARALALALAGAASAVGVLTLVCLLHRTASRASARSTRLAAHKGTLIRWAAFACPLLLLATVWIPGTLDIAEYSSLRATLYTTGVATVMATLPCAVAVLAASVGGGLARSARRTGSGGALVAGRHIAAHPGVTARLVAGIGIAMVLVSQVQLKSVQYGSTAAAAATTQRLIGTSVLSLELETGTLTRAEAEETLDALPSAAEPVAVYQTGSLTGSRPPGTRLQGDCAALKALDLTCPAAGATRRVPVARAGTRLRTVLQWVGIGPVLTHVDVRRGDVLPAKLTEDTAPASLMLVSADGRDLPEQRIKEILNARLPLGAATAGTFGETWLLGANLSAAHGRWVIFLGVPGILLLALAVALANLGEFIRFSRVLAPLTVLTGRRTVFWSTAFWGLLAPMLAATAIGCVAAVWLAAPQEDALSGITLSSAMLTGTSAGLALLSVVSYGWGARAATAEAARWRPYGE
ncbi:hypothetical protein [Streptomyces sp. YKOK-I1]